MAMMTAGTAFSIDAMLPALPQITADLAPLDPNNTALVIATFVLGLGLGTFFAGPFSDAWGRRRVVLGGSILFAAACGAALFVQSLEALLITRVLAGLGAAAPRVCVMAIIRDRFEGRQMARVTSFVMIVFTLVPAIAPVIGLGLLAISGWRSIFAAFVVFIAIYATWFWLRQPETLTPQRRRPLRWSLLIAALRETLTNPVTRQAILVQACAFGMLFGTLSSIQPIFEKTFDAADSFVWWWVPIALLAGLASVLNARIVVRLGMLKIVVWTMAAELILSLAAVGLWFATPGLFFWVFLIWQLSVFSMAGLCIGNLNAIALQPLGHIAGMAASVVTSLATVLGALIAAPIGQAFDGTPLPLMTGVAIAAALAHLLLRGLSTPPGSP